MRSETTLRVVWCIAFLTAITGAASRGQASASPTIGPTMQFDIPPEPVGSALNALAIQTHQQILFTPEIATGKMTQGVRGTLTPDQALSQLLAGTGLSSAKSSDGMILVSQSDAKGASAPSGPPSAPVGAPNDQSPVRATPTQESSGHLEEITVTARRMEEALIDAPVAVVALSPKQLELDDVTDLKKLGDLVPQLMIGNYGAGQGAVLTIRGIGSNPADFGLDPSVLVVVDGVPVSSGSVITTTLFDMKEAQVMEGPQSLFFGKNSPAGVISLSTANPTDTVEGYAKAGYEFVADERFGEGAISGPIVDTLNGRVAFRFDAMDGWVRNVAAPIADPLNPSVTFPGATQGASQPEGHNYAGRVALEWKPSDDFDATLKFSPSQQTSNGEDAYFQEYCTGNARPTALGYPEPGVCQQANQVAVSSQAPVYAANFPYADGGTNYTVSDVYLASLTLDKKFSDVNLVSTTGYYDTTYSSYQAGHGPYAWLGDGLHRFFDEFTEELRANTQLPGPVNFMGGIYFEHSNNADFNSFSLLNAVFNTAANNYSTSNFTAHGNGQYESAFGQVRWNIISSVELAAGVRYSHDKKSSTLENIYNNPAAAALGLPLYPENQPIPVNTSSNNWSPEVTLSWHPLPSQTLYVGYKRGYQAGGISNPAILYGYADVYGYNNSQDLTFKPETVDGFEGGYKADLFDHTLRIGLDAYHYEYHDLQVISQNAQYFIFLLSNAGSAITQGGDASFEWAALTHFTLHGSVGYNDAYYRSYEAAECYPGETAAQGCVGGVQSLTGAALTRAPKYTSNLGADYKARIFDGWTADISADGWYTSKYQAITDNDPGGMQSAYWRLNTALRVAPDSERFAVSIIGRNLTHSNYLITSDNYPLGGNNQFLGSFGRPAEVILQAEYNFGKRE